MAGRLTLWVALAALVVLSLVMAFRAGRDVLDDQQLPRADKQIEYLKCLLWALVGIAAGLFVFVDAFFFFNPSPPLLNRVPTR